MVNHLKAHRLDIAVGGFLALFWSWLIFVNVAVITPSRFVGRLIAIFGFLCICGISFVVFKICVKRLWVVKKVNGWVLVGFVLLWAFLEYFVSWLVAVIWIGSDGSLDSVLPFGSFTPFLSYTPLGFLGRLTGYHGLSAVFVLCILVVVHKKFQPYRLRVFGLVACLTVLSWGLYARANGPNFTATIVADQLGEWPEITVQESQLVVLPEYGLDRYKSETVNQRFATDKPVSFVGSQQRKIAEGEISNTFIYGNTTNGFLSEQDKARLIPAGEYLPYFLEWTLPHWSGGKEILDIFERRRAVAKGNDVLVPVVMSDDIVIGGAVCSSIISTKDYQQLTKKGATVLANSASLEIFRGSRMFSVQHKGLAKFMATANARPLLQSSNNGIAFAIDHSGRVIEQMQPVAASEVLVATNSARTPYTMLGEWMAVMGGGLTFVLGLRWVHRMRLRRKK